MLRSLGFETFAKFLGLGKKVSVSVLENLVSEKSIGFGFGKIWSRKKVSVSVLENLVSEKSIGFGFGKIWYRKKISVSISENLVSEKKSWYRFRSKLWYRHSVAPATFHPPKQCPVSKAILGWIEQKDLNKYRFLLLHQILCLKAS